MSKPVVWYRMRMEDRTLRQEELDTGAGLERSSGLLSSSGGEDRKRRHLAR